MASDIAAIREVFGIVLKSRDITTRERLIEVQKNKLALRGSPPIPRKSQAPPRFAILNFQ